METIKQYKLQKVDLDTEFKQIQIKNSETAYNYIRQFYESDIDIYESFFVLMLNRANKTIGYAKISQGGISGTVVDTKIIAKYAVDSLCNGIIIAHNHPSGNVNPSNNDINLTEKVRIMLLYHDIKLFDHIILTNSSYYSFLDEGHITHDNCNSNLS